MQSAKSGEKLRHVVLGNSRPSVLHMADQKLLSVIVTHFYVDLATLGEFQSVFHQVDQNLFESPLVTD